MIWGRTEKLVRKKARDSVKATMEGVLEGWSDVRPRE